MMNRNEKQRSNFICPQCGGAGTLPMRDKSGKTIGQACAYCGMALDGRGRVREISGSNVEDVLRVHHKVATSAQRPLSPWASGSFYLVALVIITIIFLAVGRLVSVWLIPVVLVAGLLGFTVVGAFQLRQDDRLSERNFVSLMRLALSTTPALLKHPIQTMEKSGASGTNEDDGQVS